MTPAQEQAIRQAIAFKRAQGCVEPVVLAPFLGENVELDGVPVYGSLIGEIVLDNGSLLDAEDGWGVLSRDEWERVSSAYAESHGPMLADEIEEALR